ncbi:precorrin-8X methylmutase [Malaciobacter mytili]|uniref:Precorrin-8X methylmutase n=1 Tax=Malaciobacter mytili LMG 24559 TaxID=1032238 RepID=A0AAX2AF40_9BACT|nr:precorrin-8X methylmutase [Malaciobacter mytili]AXH15130.1 cobalt-precorrin-8 methylmutase [Malaciobacter mytili LMG 24559]RXI44387.1 precorrin-8X methylmutase [Malaciobacter mytili]RXK15639.1 precorrin-8X methylmutase [Malaciobacter mytili LMG 24559]
MEFKIEEPPINIGADISVKSFEMIEEELKEYEKIKEFDNEQKEVISRLIHTTTCFEEVLNNIYFSKDAIKRVQELLLNKAKIIVDVNMIKVGLSDFYLKKYENEVVCYINEPFTFEMAEKNKTTRSYAAVVEAIKRHKNEPMVLACGNAPTFIYAAINTLLEEKVDLSKVALLLFPVGFVNVVESKAYGRKFCDFFDVAGIIMQGRFGSSTMSVATLHAIYKLIKDYDKDEKYNGK